MKAAARWEAIKRGCPKSPAKKIKFLTAYRCFC